ncbi:ubinuclein-1 [Ambystoma mexicanum]|uniref:ubinuclein-1 n=1 Tax=Ambystoma mexicanum TaxID=8296 RepID=UPI0037E8DB76
MAEPRRVQLNSIPVVSLTPLDLKKTLVGDGKDEPVDAEPTAAVRITLTLFEPDQKRCPEFFYPELFRNPQGKGKIMLMKEKTKEAPNLFNNGEIEKQDVETLAKKFEEKYCSKKHRRDRVQDLVDMGYGYDETDSFIDNSEAYDELVPASLTTKYGGFYINSGTLQFRQASESEEDFTKEKIRKTSKKRKMQDRRENLNKRRKEDLLKKEKISKKFKCPKTEFTELNGFKEKTEQQYTMNVSDMSRNFQKEKKAPKKDDDQTVTSSSPSMKVLMPAQQETESMCDPLLSLFGSTTASDLLRAASVMDKLNDLDLERLLNDSPDSSPFPEVEDGSEPSLGTSPEPSVKPPPSIPDGLPLSLETRILELTQAAKDPDGDQKHKFFTKEINSILLDIELQSHELSGSQRSSVYTHLASFLPFSKETLLKRARRLHRHEQGGRLKEPLQKLKEAIGRAMPQQVGRYYAECQAHTRARFARMLKEEKSKDPRDCVCSEDEDVDDKSGKRIMGPRKKFHWNEEIRDLLSRVMKIKMELFELGKNKSLGLEKYLKTFLDAEVKPLWPKGWMQARTLFKESRRPKTSKALKMARKKVIAVEKIKDSSYGPEKHFSVPGMLTAVAGSTSSEQIEFNCIYDKAAKVIPQSSAIPSSSGIHSAPWQQDNALEMDLSLQPPTKDGVTAALIARNPTTSDASDVLLSLTQVYPEKFALSATAEEKKNPLRPDPLFLPAGSLHPSFSLLMEQRMPVGRIANENKLENTSFKGLCNPLPAGKILPEINQGKHRHNSLQRCTFHGPQAPEQVSTTLPMKHFHMTSQKQKTFSLPTHMNKYPVPKAASCSLPLPPHPVFQPTQTAAKPQYFHSIVTSSSPSGAVTQVSSSSYKIPNLSCAGKLSVSSSTSTPAFKSSFLLGSIAKHVVPTSCTAHRLSLAQCFVSSSSLSVSQLPPAGHALGRPTPNTVVKKSSLSQKLTLVAPPCGSDADAGGGTYRVAKLLTSVTSAAACSTISSTPVMSLKGTSGTTVLTSTSSVNVLAPPFKSTNLPAALSSTALGILSPIQSLPLHVISFTSDSATKLGVPSKDAIVTGPAQGTLHRGLHNDTQNPMKASQGQERKL